MRPTIKSLNLGPFSNPTEFSGAAVSTPFSPRDMTTRAKLNDMISVFQGYVSEACRVQLCGGDDYVFSEMNNGPLSINTQHTKSLIESFLSSATKTAFFVEINEILEPVAKTSPSDQENMDVPDIQIENDSSLLDGKDDVSPDSDNQSLEESISKKRILSCSLEIHYSGIESIIFYKTISSGLLYEEMSKLSDDNFKNKTAMMATLVNNVKFTHEKVFESFQMLVTRAVQPFFASIFEKIAPSDNKKKGEQSNKSGKGQGADESDDPFKQLLSWLDDHSQSIEEAIPVEIFAFLPPELISDLDEGPEGVQKIDKRIKEYPTFLSEIEEGIQKIIAEVMKYTKYCKGKRERIDSFEKEIKRWSTLERTMAKIVQDLESQTIQYCISLIEKNSKQLIKQKITQEFQPLKQNAAKKYKKVLKFSQFFREIPISRVLTQTRLPKFQQELTDFLKTMRERCKTLPLKKQKFDLLYSALSKSVSDALIIILRENSFITSDYGEFSAQNSFLLPIFKELDDTHMFIKTVQAQAAPPPSAADKASSNGSQKIQLYHTRLKDRIVEIDAIIREPSQLNFVAELLAAPKIEREIENMLDDALTEFINRSDEILDFSQADAKQNSSKSTKSQEKTKWDEIKTNFKDKIEKVQNKITREIQNQIAHATPTQSLVILQKIYLMNGNQKMKSDKNKSDSKFMPLLDKIREYFDEIKKKCGDHKTFFSKQTNTCKMSAVRQIEAFSAIILYYLEIEKKLQNILKKIDHIFGKGYEKLIGMKTSNYWEKSKELIDFFEFFDPEFDRFVAEQEKNFLDSQKDDKKKISSKISRSTFLCMVVSAIVVAFLEIKFGDMKNEWERIFTIKHPDEEHKAKFEELVVEAKKLNDNNDFFHYPKEAEIKKYGRDLIATVVDARQKVQTKWSKKVWKMIESWPFFRKQEIERRNDKNESEREIMMSMNGSVLKVETGTIVSNLDPNFRVLVNEVRLMTSLFGINGIESRILLAHEAALPFDVISVSMNESLRLFQENMKRLQNVPELFKMCHAKINRFEKFVEDGFKKQWEDASSKPDLIPNYDNSLTQLAQDFVAFVKDIFQKHDKIVQRITSLADLPLTEQDFIERIGEIQKSFVDLTLSPSFNEGCGDYVTLLNSKIEKILETKLVFVLEKWKKDFEEIKKGVMSRDSFFSGSNFFPIEVVVDKDVNIIIKPPIAVCRTLIFQHLSGTVSWICSLPRIDYIPIDGAADFHDISTFHNLLPKNGAKISEIVQTVQGKLREVEDKLRQWELYHSFDLSKFSIEAISKHEKMKDNYLNWAELLNDVGKRKKEVNRQQGHDFGAIILDFNKIYESIETKYNEIFQEIKSIFVEKHGTSLTELFKEIEKEKEKMESQTSENEEGNINFLSSLGEIKKKNEKWKKDIENVEKGEQKLNENAVKMSTEKYKSLAAVMKIYENFNLLLKQKTDPIENSKEKFKHSVEEITQKYIAKLTNYQNVKNEIEKETAVFETDPAIIDKMQKFQIETLQKLKDESAKIAGARKYLDLQPLAIDVNWEEDKKGIDVLIKVWREIKRLKELIKTYRDMLFVNVDMRKFREDFEKIEEDFRKLPFEIVKSPMIKQGIATIAQVLGYNAIFKELSSKALKPKHWKIIGDQIQVSNVQIPWGDVEKIKVGHLMDAKINDKKEIVKKVLDQAQGEMNLSAYLDKVRDALRETKVEMVFYMKKCWLLKGWTDINEKISDFLRSLATMKTSSFFNVFKGEVLDLEQKLSRLYSIFDSIIEVQQLWLYLETIFTGNRDIEMQLKREAERFQRLNKEFCEIMKSIQTSPSFEEILKTENIEKNLQTMQSDLLSVQKSLGDYLEKQRSVFPRFYFVGDDDLLEIIGNKDDIEKLQKHFKKMFSGINALGIIEKKIVSMISREGEEVRFSKQIVVDPKKGVDVWLKEVEQEMKNSLSTNLEKAIPQLQTFIANLDSGEGIVEDMSAFISLYPGQVLTLALQVVWTKLVEDEALRQKSMKIHQVVEIIEFLLKTIAHLVSEKDLQPRERKKCENLITEMIHARDVTRTLDKSGVTDPNDFSWRYYMRFYYNERVDDVTKRLIVEVANAKFEYGWEYLGVCDKLVQTPLTDRCYLVLTQAINEKFGGSPFGPAGTGKTETVKMLGGQLGRYVLVFCCDENFDFKAMGRIFVGICETGAWGCFDEFNRLEEKMLSAVSQQIQTIQSALKQEKNSVELINRTVRLNQKTGVFITLNPGYAGRANLPDNLKQLFRSIAMVKPDKELISQVILFSQGFIQAEELSKKIVLFFDLCSRELSKQSHYDFGLRALKSVLTNAGNFKRSKGKEFDETVIIIQSVSESVIPKLIEEDIMLLNSILRNLFPAKAFSEIPLENLKNEISKAANADCLVYGEEQSALWNLKIIQLYQIQNLHHGIILVGPAGCGKTKAWSTLLKALEKTEGVKGNAIVIDPKAIAKDELFGFSDPTTREWHDGVFTQSLRKIIDNERGEAAQRHWIIFDGDVDPEWVENLNSVLDDNKLFTLPNGERLALPPNVKIMFEVQDLKYATLATVSRCGMVWFSEETVSVPMLLKHFSLKLKQNCITESRNPNEALVFTSTSNMIEKNIESGSFFFECLKKAKSFKHIMPFTDASFISTFFSLIISGIKDYVASVNENVPSGEELDSIVLKKILFATLWTLGSSMSMKNRAEFAEFFLETAKKYLSSHIFSSVPPDANLLDYRVGTENIWSPFTDKVPKTEIESNQVTSSEIIIPTVDTIRHEELLRSWILTRKSVVLCGPPGSGKTMILTSVLAGLPEFDVIYINFSSQTMPELIMKTFEQHTTTSKSTTGEMILQPTKPGKWLVVFCDEINLPANDKYGTQKVVTFMRQLIEKGGFWRASDLKWIAVQRIMFVGACNPPEDAGRVPLTNRFLRHCPVLFVDFPQYESLKQIYGTFIRGIFKMTPQLSGYEDPATSFLADVFTKSQKRFTAEIQPHYIYSPRDLSRWVRAIYKAVEPQAAELTREELVRLLIHEGLRIFCDRLVTDKEKEWTDNVMDETARNHFPFTNDKILARPILFSSWLDKNYVSVEKEALRDFIHQKLKIFSQEELAIELVLFDSVLEHILRIDRVFKQPLGHLLLVGTSGAGKTMLSRFVAWMNRFSVYTIKAHSKYSLTDFEEDLRKCLLQAGCEQRQIAFIFDEANVLEPSFLEYMNSLLASGEVPGLFEGDKHAILMQQCRKTLHNLKIELNSEQEIYKWFVSQVQRNLHIVFTINPSNDDFQTRAATSPALFNRCVIDWFGDWSDQALFQVGSEFTSKLDIPNHDGVVNSLVAIHKIIKRENDIIRKRTTGKKSMHVTPRHYLDLINHFKFLYAEKDKEINDQQSHLKKGLEKLQQTEIQVTTLQEKLRIQSTALTEKKKLANEKLLKMVKTKEAAEKKKEEALILSEEASKQALAIKDRKEKVQEDLGSVQPKLEEAKKALADISKASLDEIKRLVNPPIIVQKTLEAVCILLANSTAEMKWTKIVKMMVGEDFIGRIIRFKMDGINKSVKKEIAKRLEDPDLKFENVYHASKACGPMVKWMDSQLNYSLILEKVEPLSLEVAVLEQKQAIVEEQASEMTATAAKLEEEIKQYEIDYSNLIGETEKIKMEMGSVVTKVERSKKLLESLSSETKRWGSQTDSFQAKITTLLGDVLLSSAFLTYIGAYDEGERKSLFAKWSYVVDEQKIPLQENFHDNIPDYLSKPVQKLEWFENKLPRDSLCVENAIILTRFNRYPLIIDPTGQANEFLMNLFKGRIKKTSFLDPQFMKELENSIRFGSILLVQDAEYVNPVLNPVLNKEILKVDGRSVIRLGNQSVDVTPSFNLFLSTRDPTFRFDADLQSRVTFVNFIVTPASLTSQCSHLILETERPDVNQKRTNQLAKQGEYEIQLRHLEESLLEALNKSSGNILDNEEIISSLETLKKRALEIQEKARESEQVIQELATITNFYNELALLCSRTFFCLEKLSELHFLYQFSLNSFFDVLKKVLKVKTDNNIDPKTRLEILVRAMFFQVYSRYSRTLFFSDRVLFAFRLAQIYLKNVAKPLDISEEERFLLKGFGASSSANSSGLPDTLSGLSNTAKQNALGLSKLVGFEKYLDHVRSQEDDWKHFLDISENKHAFQNVPLCWTNNSEKEAGLSEFEQDILTEMRKIIVLRVFREDSLIAGLESFVDLVFSYSSDSNSSKIPTENSEASASSGSFMKSTLSQTLDDMIKDTDSQTPIILASTPGFDASTFIDDITKRRGKKCFSVAMGTKESYVDAEKAINYSIKTGDWVLLKNVHLSASFLSQLEKKFYDLKLQSTGQSSGNQPASSINAEFKIYLTTEVHPALPINLLRLSQIIVFEPAQGMKASLQQIFNQRIPSTSSLTKLQDNCPLEISRLYMIIAWLHSAISERLRYTPIGWSKTYEFNESDLQTSFQMLETWMRPLLFTNPNSNELTLKKNGLNDVSEIPWKAFRSILSSSIYGGKIDNEFDQKILDGFVEKFCSAESFNANFKFVDTEQTKIEAPQLMTKKVHEFSNWVKDLPAETPEWMGMSSNVQILIKIDQAIEGVKKIIKIQDSFELETSYSSISSPLADISVASGSSSTSAIGLEPPIWAKDKLTSDYLSDLLKLLPIEDTEKQIAGEELLGNSSIPISSITTLLGMNSNMNNPSYAFNPSVKINLKTDKNSNPVLRFFIRECEGYQARLKSMKRDLKHMLLWSQGLMEKPTNHHRELLKVMINNSIPPQWDYPAKSLYSNSLWNFVNDFVKRMQNLNTIVTRIILQADYNFFGAEKAVWIGGLLYPEAFMTATRQFVASNTQIALEKLELVVRIGEKRTTTKQNEQDKNSFSISGVAIQSCLWDDAIGALKLSDRLLFEVPIISFTWVAGSSSDLHNNSSEKENIVLPYYLDSRKQTHLASFNLPIHIEAGESSTDIAVQFFQRGCCLFAWRE